MPIYETETGFVRASRGVWSPGVFATYRAAQIARWLREDLLRSLWERKAFAENGNTDGTTDYALTEDDIEAELRERWKHNPDALKCMGLAT